MITGSSVHNQRIERLWRDIFQGVIYIYYNLFFHLEECGILESGNSLHLFALHYVFIPRINHHLDTWKGGYIRHQIRTAGHRTPMQLYILGLLGLRGSSRTIAREVYSNKCRQTSNVKTAKNFSCYSLSSDTYIFDLQDAWSDYGIDWDGPLPENNEDGNEVEVPETRNPLSGEKFYELSNTIHPLRASDCYGIDIYQETVGFILSSISAEDNMSE